ncbi:MAG: ABC transporter ATP-binding protein [Candidatus Saccharibacteria bacterium]|nr:ABC transporter ATP-binding protein [Candidatus Saccharibacteria bacterium]
MTTKDKKKINIKRTLHYFWQALMQYKVRTVLLLLLIPVRIFILNILVPRETSNILGMLSAGNFELSSYAGTLCYLIGAVTLSNLVITRIADWLDWSLDAKCGEYLSQLSFNAIITQSMTFHSNHFSGSLTSQANKLTSAFIDLKSNFVWDIFPLLLTIAYSIIAALIICPPFALILILFVVFYFSAAIYTYVKTTHYDADLASAENKQTGQLADSVTNMISVKSYAREKFEKRRYERATGATKKAIFGLAKVSYFRNSILNVIGTITFAAVIILVILSNNLFGLSLANMIFLYSLSSSLVSEIWTLNHILRVVNRAFSNASEMVEILDMPYIVDDKTDKALEIRNAAIDFSHITFRHEEQKEKLFVDFNLEIPAGKTIGLVGVSGSGKSTLTKLLLRFADVKAGAIYIDGQDIRDVTQNSLREAIAYVPQESSLFHRSVFENIAYGKPGATEEEVKRAAKLANADEFIKKLPDGYETMVGERGVKLSGGQRQRIAIARAILKNAPILVLDEATSALDSESEALIQEALNNLMKDRTSIVVAHRLSTIAGLDEIVVLDDGKIVEQGNHAELLKQNGEYAKLWSRQSGAFLEN